MIEKRWSWVSLHGSIKELSDFCSLSRGGLALSTWTSANLRNNDISGPNEGLWWKYVLSCYHNPSHLLHTTAAYFQNQQSLQDVTAGQSPILPSQHTSPLLLHCSACLLFSLSVSSCKRVLFISSLRKRHSTTAFIVSIAANSLVQSLLTALHGTCHVLVPAYQMIEDFNIRLDKTQLCCFSPVRLWQIITVSTKILHEVVFTA